uniref:NAD(P)-binding domain-containing protein n=1 Tax=Aureoumbra lagunensis TaxID=44058 RepID=A0A7S3JZM2_9STRA
MGNSEVISVSRNPKPASTTWSSQVRYVRGDALTDDLVAIFRSADAVISCVGALGSDDDARNNGETNERIALAAKQVGASRFAYVSVHPLVSDAASDIFPAYLAGKKRAEQAIRSNFPDACIIRPTLIYGGDSFNVNPPRVPTGYGAFVDATLSSGPFRTIADAASPLPALKLALLPPVDNVTVGKALAIAALSDESPPRDVIGKDQIAQLAAGALS